MKKILLFAISLLQFGAIGQTIQNGDFENWTTTPYNELNGWSSGNFYDIQRLGMPSVTKVTGVSGFGIRIQINTTSTDTSESFVINTNNPCSSPDQWKGGVPLTQQPTAITGQYRYNLLGNDTAIFIVIFRKNGVHIGDNLIKIRGTGSQSTFTPFSFSLTCVGVPDSVIFAAAPSNKAVSNFAHNGSFIELDNLAFAGTSQTIPNSNFENWTAKTYDKPNAWSSWGNGVTKTTSSMMGFALRLETTLDICGGASSSGATNGLLSNFSGPRGGVPFVNTIDTLKGYYKYTSMGMDTANISINLTKNGSNVGGGWRKLVATPNYLYFEVPINAFTNPDTMRIDIQSSKWPTTLSNIGSVLFIDNLSLKSQSVGVFEKSLLNHLVYSYPNPTEDIIYLKNESNIVLQNMAIYDAIGKLIFSQELTNNSTPIKIELSNLTSGIYYYSIKTIDGSIIRDKFIKQ